MDYEIRIDYYVCVHVRFKKCPCVASDFSRSIACILARTCTQDVACASTVFALDIDFERLYWIIHFSAIHNNAHRLHNISHSCLSVYLKDIKAVSCLNTLDNLPCHFLHTYRCNNRRRETMAIDNS